MSDDINSSIYKKTLRIAFFGFFPISEPMGATAFIEISNELCRMGHKVYLITINYINSKRNRKSKYTLSATNINVIKIPALFTERNIITPIKVMNLILYNILLIFLLLFMSTIIRLHAIISVTQSIIPTTIISKIFRIPQIFRYTRTRKIVFSSKVNIYDIAYNILEKFAIRNSEAIIVAYNIQYEHLCKIYPWIDKRKVFVCLPGVNLRLFKKSPNILKRSLKIREMLGINDDVMVFCYLGGFRGRNLQDLIYALYSLVKKGKRNIRLLFIGDDTESLKLKEFVNKLRLSNYVVFTGYVPYEEVPAYLAASNIGISYLPCNDEFWRRAEPIKLLEYLAMELPVIATDIPYHREFIKNNINGLIIKSNSKDLANAMLICMEKYDLLKKGVRKTIREIKQYTWRKTAEEYYEIISKKGRQYDI